MFCYGNNSIYSHYNYLSIYLSRLAAAYTGEKDVVTFKDGYFGNLDNLTALSNKMHEKYVGHKAVI